MTEFKKPAMEVILFDKNDIITSSNDEPGPIDPVIPTDN